MSVSKIVDLDLARKKKEYKRKRRDVQIQFVIRSSNREMKRRKKKKRIQEIIVDNFAGGGGASVGIENALRRFIDIAINHDPDAIAMHETNHPNTRHYCEDVFSVDPIEAAAGRPVALCWFSPDCKHFSKAKGSTPVNKSIRGLAWVALNWASKVRPRVIILENVPEFESWGPLEARRDSETKRVLVVDDVFINGKWQQVERIAEPGEVIPFEKQVFQPKDQSKGEIFQEFQKQFKRLGYVFEFKQMAACDFGAPTTRKRLFMIARCDGEEIVWPEATHGPRDSEEVMTGKLQPYRPAAEVIDWSLPGTSIFERRKPLVKSTLNRIARGIKKYVVDNPDPFIVTVNHTGAQFRGQSIHDPLNTLTAKNGYGLVIPNLIQMGYGDPDGKRVLDLDNPLGTITAGGNKFGLVSTWIKSDYGQSVGTSIEKPLGTITSQSNHHSIMLAFLTKCYGGNYSGAGIDLRNPTNTVTSVDHHSLVSVMLSEPFIKRLKETVIELPCNYLRSCSMLLCQNYLSKNIGNSLMVEKFLQEYLPDQNSDITRRNTAFLVKYYGRDTGQSLDYPLHTVPTKDRFGLVMIHGVAYQIFDITMRMLQPHELALAQGVPKNYIIDQDKNGKKISKAKQVARIGNMVVPHCSEALVRANLPELCSNKEFNDQIELLSEDFYAGTGKVI